MTASARSLGVWRALLAAFFICVSVASGSTVARPAVEYSCNLSQRGSLAPSVPIVSHHRAASEQAPVAAPYSVTRRSLSLAGDRPLYELTTSGHAGIRAYHDYEATGPPTTRNSRSA